MPIAIIGMGCLFPKADNTRSFWANIKSGVDAITEVPESHWNAKDFYNPDAKAQDMTNATRGGFLSPVDFDPLEFGIQPNVLEATDSAQLLGLYVAKQALLDAGYNRNKEFDRERVSVLLGVTGALELTTTLGARLGHPKWRKALKDAGVSDKVAEDVINRIHESYVPWQENSFPGLLGNVVAGRISNFLDLHGTNCAVDAACASSLSAVHLALLELEAHRSDMVVTGGIDTFNDIFMYTCFSKTQALSPTGDARPFDSQGDGTILGEGLGVLVLKRLEDARRDKDKIHASADGQKRALKRAYEYADISPDTIELIEAHGTGTTVGDEVELSALTDIYKNSSRNRWCAIGSVKSQIGHTKAGAGAAGIIKAALALQNKILPPTIKVHQPVGAFNDKDIPFYLNIEKKPWLPRGNHPRRAGVSSFGFGGSNFHCVLEENENVKAVPDWDGYTELLAISGDSIKDVQTELQSIDPEISWDELIVESDKRRLTFNHKQKARLAIAFKKDSNVAKILKRIQSMFVDTPDKASWSTPEGAYFSSLPEQGELAFLFPGQGAQYVGMCRDLSCQFPQFLDALATADKVVDEPRLSDIIFPPSAFDDKVKAEQEETLRATMNAQPAIGAISLGVLRTVESFGLKPSFVAGHSYGEFTALHAARMIDEKTFFNLSRLRGELMTAQSGDKGGMLAVKASIDTVESVIKEAGLDLVVANRNAPQQYVLSGGSDQARKAKAVFSEKGIQCNILPVSAAFHSKLVSDAAEPFYEAIKKVKISKGKIPVFSNTTAVEYPSDPEKIRKLMAFQLANPVDFIQEIENIYDRGARTFLEVGPGSRLSGLVRSILGDREFSMISIDRESNAGSGMFNLAKALAQLATLGYKVDLTPWNTGLAERLKAKKKPKMSVPIKGINHVTFRQSRPPVPEKPVEEQKAPVGLPAPAVAQTMQAAQENLIALQKMQEQTAILHRQFLEGQQAAANALNSIMKHQKIDTTGFVPSHETEQAPEAAKPVEQIVQKKEEPAVQSHAETVLLETIADKTGYPVDMLDLDMTLDGDLGIDSIKRVEILSALQESLPEAPAIEAKDLSKLQTLRQIVDYLSAHSAHSTHSASSAQASSAQAQAQEIVHTQGPGQDRSGNTRILLEIVSDKTGYPVDMLDLDMALDADLGIDSIKRVEILSALTERIPGAPPIDAAHLSTIQTLKHIVDHLSKGGAPPITQAAPIQQDSAEHQSILLEIISDKTGYPVDMLELEMSLDADLGIDSIKRVEILSALQERLPSAPSIDAKDLSRIQTLTHILDRLTASAPVKEEAKEIIKDPVAEKETATVKNMIERIVLKCDSLDEAATQKAPYNMHFWITDSDSKLASSIMKKLNSEGCSAEKLDLNKLDDAVPPDGLSGLIILTPEDGADHGFLHNAFKAARLAEDNLRSAKDAIFITVSRLDGSFGLKEANGECGPLSGGLAGLLKTAHHEWPEVRCKAVDLAHDMNDPDETALAVVKEMFIKGPLEVGLQKGDRLSLSLHRAPLQAKGAVIEKKPLGKGDPIIITGGARGVTADVAIALAETFKPVIALLGRSPEPHDEPDWLQNLENAGDIKKAIIENSSEKMTPRELEGEYLAIESNRQMLANIKVMEDKGATVRYFSADLRNSDDVANAVTRTRDEFGPIKGIIHGAGVLADKLIKDKTEEQFSMVYDTKVKGLNNILCATETDDLKVIVLFSSSTGRFGRKGQVDYSVANEVLNKTAWRLSQTKPECRTVSINWGPWDGGMVTPALKKVFEDEGVGLINPKAGADYLIQEICSADACPSEVLLMGGPLPDSISINTEDKQNPAEDLAFEVDLNTKDYPFLTSHVINGAAVLPAAITFEWLAQSAMHLNPGFKLVGVKNFKVFKGVILNGDETASISFHTSKINKNIAGYSVTAQMRGALADKKMMLFASADIILDHKLSKDAVTIPDANLEPFDNNRIYKEILFHGPEFQSLADVSFGADNTITAHSSKAPAPSKWMKKTQRSSWLADPIALDSSFQLLIIWSFKTYGIRSLPNRIGAYDQFKKSFPKKGVKIIAKVTKHNKHKALAVVEFIDEKTKELVARITDYEFVIDESLNDAFKRNSLQENESFHQMGTP